MNTHLTPKEQEALEKLIDRTSLHLVLGEIAGICYAKADHIRGEWNDRSLAGKWERHARLIEGRADSAQLDDL